MHSLDGHSALLAIEQVVVLTHAYGLCTGVRWMKGGLKVYYAPRVPIVSQACAQSLWAEHAALVLV
jgi:hypothetical protein